MAIPAGVIATAAQAMRDPLVRDTARTVFGWLKQQRSGGVTEHAPAVDAAALLADVPTRADLALALAQLEVRIAQAERRCVRTIVGGLLLSTVLLSGAIILT
ncbi:MAG TPA: hypothetical protein VEZ48_06090 [Sphingomonadaceae bacterium]|jgi:hypothetical protein|nr:hypothetical protein [Sphingomonadaceae bacterium]